MSLSVLFWFFAELQWMARNTESAFSREKTIILEVIHFISLTTTADTSHQLWLLSQLKSAFLHSTKTVDLTTDLIMWPPTTNIAEPVFSEAISSKITYSHSEAVVLSQKNE